jgi:SAM-dependent methyltransferase
MVARAIDVVRKVSRPTVTRETRLSTRSEAREHTVLIVSHSKKRCGINQYGLNVYEALAASQRYAIAYAECDSERDLTAAMATFNPSVALYNYYPLTMPWLDPSITRKFALAQAGVMHEVTQEEADTAGRALFDYHLCPDPTLRENNPAVLKIPRIIPPYHNTRPLPDRVRIGSAGFGIHDKGFSRLIARVQEEYDDADISILMPFNDVVDPEGKIFALKTADSCRQAVHKPGIRLTISHDFVTRTELLDFLADNTLNAFFYDTRKNRGISSIIEHALAVQRPLAITRSGMFRHVSSATPSICIEDTSLVQIIENGTAPLTLFHREWTGANFLAALERVFDTILAKPAVAPARDLEARGFNRILDNRARLEHGDTIKRLFQVAPQTMARKIQEANVQQAFVADATIHFARRCAGAPRILCVGAFEDTATEIIRAEGLEPEEIDPTFNHDLDTFFHLPSTRLGSYDLVYSTSVLEHVKEDGRFVAQICDLLSPGGVAILTCDFDDLYRDGGPKPKVDHRLYTERDLRLRLGKILTEKGCLLVDAAHWKEAEPDFVYMGIHRYTFATLVFRKGAGAACKVPSAR